MANDFRRVPFPPKVNPFQAEISRDQHFMALGNAQDGTVVANPGNHPRPEPLLLADGGY